MPKHVNDWLKLLFAVIYFEKIDLEANRIYNSFLQDEMLHLMYELTIKQKFDKTCKLIAQKNSPSA